MDKTNSAKSVIQLSNLHVSNMSFSRNSEITDSELVYQFARDIAKQEDGTFIITIRTHVRNKDESLNIHVSIVGCFSFSEDIDETSKNTLITKNAVAILFPYLRSQVSILTAQPGLAPFIMPILNINRLFEDGESDETGIQ